MADTPHLLHGAEHGIGSLADGRGRIHARHILRDAGVRVDSEHLVDELVLEGPAAELARDRSVLEQAYLGETA